MALCCWKYDCGKDGQNDEDMNDHLIFQDYPLRMPTGFPLVNFVYRCNFFLVITLK